MKLFGESNSWRKLTEVKRLSATTKRLRFVSFPLSVLFFEIHSLLDIKSIVVGDLTLLILPPYHLILLCRL